ncbi:MAG: Crp/Fnr family transcriptional regulator [Chloroflexi bacterium]|nr:Crp/Fnr family transcriptional regulator [Chloroflexota bacterium]
MAITVQTLSQLPFFAGLDDDALRDIAPHVHERTFSSGQLILLEGDPCQALYFVVQGVVRTSRTSLSGREYVLAYLGPGEPLSLVPALDGGSHLATVDAVTDTTLYTIPCERFQRIVRQHPEVALAVMERLTAEVRRLSDVVEDLALHTVRTRLARFLLAQAEAPQPSHRWTQEKIAAHIGSVREMVVRTLRTFAAAGLIRRQRGRVIVVDREGLEREATGV